MLDVLTALLLAASTDAGALTANLLVTNQPGTVVMRLQQGEKLELSNIKTARRGEPIAAFVLFSDCRPGEDGKCDVRMNMTVVDPNGKVYGESKESEVWSGKAPPTRGATQLGVGYMMIQIGPQDPPGKYRVKAHITDHVAGSDLDREWSFDVAPHGPGDSVASPK